jgi:uncharacterized pyridoxal phosphate-containing UPF0001 family protein
VQVNTSGEASKFGCEPAGCVPLVKHVVEQCSSLDFAGLMTIGRLDDKPTEDCFRRLVECRDAVESELKISRDKMELSMGMSHDYELAMSLGATIVRVGSAIFGARDYSAKVVKSGSSPRSQPSASGGDSAPS